MSRDPWHKPTLGELADALEDMCDYAAQTQDAGEHLTQFRGAWDMIDGVRGTHRPAHEGGICGACGEVKCALACPCRECRF